MSWPTPCDWKWFGLLLRDAVMGLNVTMRSYFALKASYRYYKTYDTALQIEVWLFLVGGL